MSFLGMAAGSTMANQQTKKRVSEPFYSSVVFLSNFEGNDGATTLVEQSRSALTVTFEETAQIDTAQARFGSSSLLLDGDSDYVHVPHSVDWSLGNGDFTIEVDARYAVDPGTGTSTFIGHYGTVPPNRSWVLDVSNNVLRFGWSTNGSDFSQNGANWNPVIDTWYTLAVVRDGNSMYFYVDGTRLDTDSITDTLHDSPNGLWIGGLEVGSPSGPNLSTLHNGWIDNVRVTKGVARYTGDTYELPTAEYPSA